jgi:hypothetical protein
MNPNICLLFVTADVLSKTKKETLKWQMKQYEPFKNGSTKRMVVFLALSQLQKTDKQVGQQFIA